MENNGNPNELVESLAEVMWHTRKRKYIEKPAIKYNSKNGWSFLDVAYGYGIVGQEAALEARRQYKHSQPENDIKDVL